MLLLSVLLIGCGLLCPASCGASPTAPAVTTSSEPSPSQRQQRSSAETVDAGKPVVGAPPTAITVITSSDPSPSQQQQHSSAETVDAGKPVVGAPPTAPAVTTSSDPSPSQQQQQQQHSSAETVDVDKPAAEPQPSVTLDQVIDMISDFQQATTRASTAQPLAELAKTLAVMQASVLAISGRLNVIQDSQLQQQKVQVNLAKRLNVMEQSQTEAVAVSQASVLAISGRLDVIQDSQLQQQNVQADLAKRLNVIEQSQSQISSRLDDLAQSQNVASGRLDIIQNTLGRLDGLQQNQTEAVGRLVEVREAQSTLSSGLPARLDVIETSLGTLSGRVGTVLQQRQQQAAVIGTPTAAQEQLDAILAAVSRIPKTVLGTSCGSDTDCSRLMPEATCGDSGLCSCRDGYRQVSDTVCRMVPRLTEPCLEEADCQTLVANATCTGGFCACAGGFWNHNNRECRQVSAVAKDGSCIGDQDCAPISRVQCFSGTCSCPSKTIGNEEYRLVGGSSCTEGNVALRKRGGSWGVVCDDYWETVDAGVLCRSLDFSTGTPTTGSLFGRATNFYMDDVGCTGSETRLTACGSQGWGSHNCGAGEVAGVYCS